MNPARAIYSRMHSNAICGHFHRFSTHGAWSANGKQHVVWTNGCLASLTPHYTLKPDWTQGFSIVDYTKSGLFNVTPVMFFPMEGEKRAIVEGRVYGVGGQILV